MSAALSLAAGRAEVRGRCLSPCCDPRLPSALSQSLGHIQVQQLLPASGHRVKRPRRSHLSEPGEVVTSRCICH